MPDHLRREAKPSVRELALPDPGEVWIYWLDLDIGAATLGQTQLLDVAERQRADRRSGDGRTRFIAARAALRRILGSCLAIRPEDVSFRYGDCGRPDLAVSMAPHGLHFNISHSGPLGLLALVRDQRIGADVERLRPLRHLDRIVNRVFGDRDRSTLLALPPSRFEAGFFESWTRKEAVVKALGGGIFHTSATALTREPDPAAARGEPPAAADPVDTALAAGNWTVLSLAPPVTGFAASLAVDRPAIRIRDRSQDLPW